MVRRQIKHFGDRAAPVFFLKLHIILPIYRWGMITRTRNVYILNIDFVINKKILILIFFKQYFFHLVELFKEV